MTPTAPITLSTSIPTTTLHGFSSDNELLVILAGWPHCQQLHGTEQDSARVARWVCGPDAFRRIAAISMWAAMGYGVAGHG